MTRPGASRATARAEIERLIAARRRVLRAIAAIPPRARARVRVGEWSPDDVLRHLLGWDRTNLRAVREVLRGELPSFYRCHDRDWRSYNARLVRRYRRLSGSDLVEELQGSHQALVAAASRLPTGERAKDRGIRFRGWRVTITQLLETEARYEVAHAQGLRSAFAAWQRRR